MPIDPQVQALLDAMAAAGSPLLSHETLAETREGFAAMVGMLAGEAPGDVTIAAAEIDGMYGPIAIRTYRPGSDGPHPAVLFMHGGGWTIGTAAGYDTLVAQICAAADVVVVSVDYRLAPEYPFPVAYDECWTALQWVAEDATRLGVDPARLAVMGDSAGGNLAACLALRARDEGGPGLAAQVLVYPVTDADLATLSYDENATGYFLERATMQFFWDCYTGGGADRFDARLSPLRAASHADLPPALVITAEYDPLRDEGEAYARCLEQAGVPVEAMRYDGMIHGFFMMPGVLGAGADAVRQATRALRRAFGTLPA
jgi:acetyl esterase